MEAFYLPLRDSDIRHNSRSLGGSPEAVTAVFLKRSWPSAAHTISLLVMLLEGFIPRGYFRDPVPASEMGRGVLFVQGPVGGAVATTLKDPRATFLLGRLCAGAHPGTQSQAHPSDTATASTETESRGCVPRRRLKRFSQTPPRGAFFVLMHFRASRAPRMCLRSSRQGDFLRGREMRRKRKMQKPEIAERE